MNTDSLIIDIQSTSKDSTKNIDSLVESLENLNKALSDVISQSNSFKNLKNITSGVKSSNSVHKQKIQPPSKDEQLEKLGISDFQSLQKGLLSETKSYDKTISKYKTDVGDIVRITEKATKAGQVFNVALTKRHTQPTFLEHSIKEFDKFKELKNSTFVLNKDVSNLRSEINKTNVDVSKFSLDETFKTGSKEIKKYKNELHDTLIITKKLKNGVPIYDIGVKSSKKNNQENIGIESRDAQLRKLNVGDFKSLQKNLISEITSDDKVISKYKTNLGGIVTIIEKTTKAGQKFNVTLKQTHPQVKTFSEQLKNAQNVMGKLQAKMVALGAGLIGMVKKAVDFVDMASAEAEALNLFTVSMGEYAEEGTRWLEKFSNALYLDPVSVQQYMGSFNSLVKGLGVGSDNAYKMSKNLTQLVYDLSSFKNISIESSYEKLMSGISGELEPLILVAIICEYYRKRSEPTNVGCGKVIYC